MGKFEVAKCAQIHALISENQYLDAMDEIEALEFDKIPSLTDLYSFADLFLKAEKLDVAKELYYTAYRRTASRPSLYRLLMLVIRMGDVEEAEELYLAYEIVAGITLDTYELRYRLANLKGEPRSKLIEILEDLKKEEYTEEWGLQLAKLYEMEGLREKCIDECERLELWFGKGNLVDRARELKARCMSASWVKPMDEEIPEIERVDLEDGNVSTVRKMTAVKPAEVEDIIPDPEADVEEEQEEVPSVIMDELAMSVGEIMDAEEQKEEMEVPEQISEEMPEQIDEIEVPQPKKSRGFKIEIPEGLRNFGSKKPVPSIEEEMMEIAATEEAAEVVAETANEIAEGIVEEGIVEKKEVPEEPKIKEELKVEAPKVEVPKVEVPKVEETKVEEESIEEEPDVEEEVKAETPKKAVKKHAVIVDESVMEEEAPEEPKQGIFKRLVNYFKVDLDEDLDEEERLEEAEIETEEEETEELNTLKNQSTAEINVKAILAAGVGNILEEEKKEPEKKTSPKEDLSNTRPQMESLDDALAKVVNKVTEPELSLEDTMNLEKVQVKSHPLGTSNVHVDMSEEISKNGILYRSLKGTIYKFREEDETIHFALAGGSDGISLAVAKRLFKELKKMQYFEASNIGKIDATKLDEVDLDEWAEKFIGGCMYIMNAPMLTRDSIVKLSALMDLYGRQIVVILSGGENEMEEFLKNNLAFEQRITYKVKL